MLQGEHSAILLSFIKLPFVIKIFILSIFEWPFYTSFTVHDFVSVIILCVESYHNSKFCYFLRVSRGMLFSQFSLQVFLLPLTFVILMKNDALNLKWFIVQIRGSQFIISHLTQIRGSQFIISHLTQIRGSQFIISNLVQIRVSQFIISKHVQIRGSQFIISKHVQIRGSQFIIFKLVHIRGSQFIISKHVQIGGSQFIIFKLVYIRGSQFI